MLLALLHILSLMTTVADGLTEFVQSPSPIVYGILSDSVSLTWSYGSHQAIIRMFSHVYPNNTAVLMLSIQNTGNTTHPKYVPNFNPELENRLTFTQEQAGIILSGLTVQDEGTIRCAVTFSNYDALSGSILLKIITTQVLSLTPQTLTVGEFTNITLHCIVNSRPISNVTWYKGNTKLMNNSIYTITESVLPSDVTKSESRLTMPNATRNDTGSYKCEASYEHGVVEDVSTVNVNFKPENTVLSVTPETTTEGTDVIIKCTAHSLPPPEFSIYNSTSLMQKEIFGALILRSVRNHHEGEYKCQASNSVGNGKLVVKNLTIYVKPSLLSPSATELRVTEGKPIKLFTEIQGDPQPMHFWSMPQTANDIIESNGIISSKLGLISQFNNLSKAATNRKDAGVYTYYANNTHGFASRQITLIVEFAPEVIGPDPLLHVEENTFSFLSCNVSSFPMATVTWYYAADIINFVNISSRSTIENLASAAYESNITSKLNFPNGVKRLDVGAYYCEVENSGGMVKKQTEIRVDWKSEFTTFLAPSSVKVGEELSLTCIVESSSKPLVSWHKDGVSISPTTYIENIASPLLSRTTTTLVIASSKVADAGQYVCKATNNIVDVPTSVERDQDVKILYPPIVTASPTNQDVEIGQLLTMSCSAHAYPAIQEYRWTKDNVTVPNNSSTLEISYIDRGTQGEYKCAPINSEGVGGSVTHNIVVKVLPTFTKSPMCKQVVKTILHCECDGVGHPPPTVYWTKASDNSTVSNEKTFNITIGPDSAGTYYCNLKNLNGVSSLALEVVDYVPTVTEWSTWSACNVSCGDGFRHRDRSCNFQPCTESKLDDRIDCVGTACPVNEKLVDGWHEDWYIAFWVAIPLLAVFFIMCCLWCCRTTSRSNKPQFVPVNRDITRVPSTVTRHGSIQTARDIYLPSQVTMSALNSGYLADDILTPQLPKRYEDLEAEMNFEEEIGVSVLPSKKIPVILEVSEDRTPPQMTSLRNSPQTPRSLLDYESSPYNSLYDSKRNRSKKPRSGDGFSYRDLNGYM